MFITSVKIVHDIERVQKSLRLIGAVHAVIDGNEANAVSREGDLRIVANTEVITTHSAEVFYKDNAHLTGFQCRKSTVSSLDAQNSYRSNRRQNKPIHSKISFTGIAREHIL